MIGRRLQAYELASRTAVLSIPGIFQPDIDEQRDELPNISRQIGNLVLPVAGNYWSAVNLDASVDRRLRAKSDPSLRLLAILADPSEITELHVGEGAVIVGSGWMNLGGLAIGQPCEAPLDWPLVQIVHDREARELCISGVVDVSMMLNTALTVEVRDFQGEMSQ